MEEMNIIFNFVFNIVILVVIAIGTRTIHNEYLKDKRKERELVDAKIERIRKGEKVKWN